MARALEKQTKNFIQFPRQDATTAVKQGFYRISARIFKPCFVSIIVASALHTSYSHDPKYNQLMKSDNVYTHESMQ
ncbi:hypothetical protein CHS0354_000118 [Potamilus streckersoni]|uniref:Uncharacterized protein n=1 Tax=Potamilus streckersoni TaxID=2493646 RepID=A0AAE0RYE2_9BIVA|nr:hypothetical protein CHS0354_000118 [Potamilus streckersoni]